MRSEGRGEVNYEEWVKTVPEEITGDSLWKAEAYRLSLFATELGWYDAAKMIRDKRMHEVADQLCRALGSIIADIAEGYSRGTGMNTLWDQFVRAVIGIVKVIMY